MQQSIEQKQKRLSDQAKNNLSELDLTLVTASDR